MATDRNIKTKLWLWGLPRFTVDKWWIDMSRLTRVFSCNFAFIFDLQKYKEAITAVEFVVEKIFFGRLRPEDTHYCHS